MLLATETVTAIQTAAVPELRIETVTDYRSFRDLEPAWNKLVEEAGIDYPFLRHEWMRIWWESFGAGRTLHILVAKRGDDTMAIAPFMLSSGWMYGVKVRRLQLLHNDHTPRLDFIVARSSKEAYRAIWRHLAGETARWDVLELGQLPAGSRTLEELPRLAAADGFLTGLWPSADSPYVTLSGSWEDYFKSLDRKHRSNLRNRFKRLSGLGPVELDVISSCEQLESALEDGLQLEASAWKAKAGTAISCQLELRQFYRRLAESAAARGWLRLSFLTVNRRRIAFHYSLCYANKIYLLKGGYDPQYAPYSPSNLLCNLVLQDAFEHGITEYDFLGNNESWKLEWTNQARPHYWLFVLPNVLRTRLVHYAKFRLIPTLKRRPSTGVQSDAARTSL